MYLLSPPQNFKEAVQSIWFTFAFVRLCGNWPGIGRLDEMLGCFLTKDLQDGAITLVEAREFLCECLLKAANGYKATRLAEAEMLSTIKILFWVELMKVETNYQRSNLFDS